LGRAKKINAHQVSLSGARLRGRKCPDPRLRIEAILWILRTGAPWRDLPEGFGPWQSVYASFRRWSASGLWLALWTGLRERHRDDEYLLIDSTSARVHQHGAGPVGGQLAHAMARSKASLSSKIHLASDALGYPLGFIITAANVNDYDQCKPLLAKHLKPNCFAIMDKGYDSDSNRAYVNQLGGIAVIATNASRSKNPPLTSISTASDTASKTSSQGSSPSAASPPATTNSSAPSQPWSPSPACSSGSNINDHFANTA
jgi:transposase